MSLSSEELAKLAEEIYTDRRITMSTYCGRCGQNLRTLPYVYRCPECGNAYNARPLKQEGVFSADHARFPLGTLFALLVTAAGAALFVATYLGYATPLRPPPPPVPAGTPPPPPVNSPALDSVGVAITATLVVLLLLYLVLACRQVRAWWRAIWIARRIAQAEADEP